MLVKMSLSNVLRQILYLKVNIKNQNSSSKKARIGKDIKSSIVRGKSFNSYIPSNLPPEPPIDMNEIYPLLDKANTALGRLDGISLVLPDPALFLYMYVRIAKTYKRISRKINE